MQVRVWQSYSCNNSSSFYLVARFETAETASAVAEELTAFFKAHGQQCDAMYDTDDDPMETPTEAASRLAGKHGFEWTDFMLWGDGGMEHDEPHVWAIGSSLLIYHGYCGGGLGRSLAKYLAAVGAGDDTRESDGTPLLAIRFAVPDDPLAREAAGALAAYIDALADQARGEDGWVFSASVAAPWGAGPTEDMEFECGVPFPGWHDGHSVGLALEIPKTGLWEAIPDYLRDHNIADFRITVDEPGVVKRFQTIAAAACRECGARPMRYVEASTQGAPTDQLACESCGGMFELEP